MRFISLWVSTAFSTKYGSIFITASCMCSNFRCILLTDTKRRPPRQELPPFHLPPETVKGHKKTKGGFGSFPAAFQWQSDWQAALICAPQWRSAVCSNATPSLSYSSLIWASVCLSASHCCLEGCTAASTRCLGHSQPCLQSVLSVLLFYARLNIHIRKKKKQAGILLFCLWQTLSSRDTKSIVSLLWPFNKIMSKKLTGNNESSRFQEVDFSSMDSETYLIHQVSLSTKRTTGFLFSQPGPQRASCVAVQPEMCLSNAHWECTFLSLSYGERRATLKKTKTDGVVLAETFTMVMSPCVWHLRGQNPR